MLQRMLQSISSATSEKKRSPAVALVPFLLGGMLLTSQGCVASVDAPEEGTAAASINPRREPGRGDRREAQQVAEAVRQLPLPSRSSINKIRDSAVKSASMNAYDALRSFQATPVSDLSAFQAAAEQMNIAAQALRDAISGGGEHGADELGLSPEHAESSADVLSRSRERSYRRCNRNALTGYTLCLATATTVLLKGLCSANFTSLSLGCIGIL